MIKTMFGVHIPPWRKPKPEKNITITMVYAGWIPSKKNMQVPSFNFSWAKHQIRLFRSLNPAPTSRQTFSFLFSLLRKIKPYIMHPKKFTEWEQVAKEQTVKQAAWWKEKYEAHQLMYPITKCSISIRHYWADSRVRDNSNKAETIHDLLVSSGIIADDRYQCLRKTTSEADCFKNEVTDHITVVSITAYAW